MDLLTQLEKEVAEIVLQTELQRIDEHAQSSRYINYGVFSLE